MFTEDDLLPISALQHLAFCPRQCALIHIECAWAENRFTAEGRAMHDAVHKPQSEYQDGVHIARSLRLHSFRLGLVGQADVVEFHQLPNDHKGGVELNSVAGKWMPFPVEYKRGKPKAGNCDIVQICAQAICVEEMLGTTIEKGALFYGKPRRRQEIAFSNKIRLETETLTLRLHELIGAGKTPPARYEKKCGSCSLYEICAPKTTGIRKDINRYLASARTILEENDNETSA